MYKKTNKYTLFEVGSNQSIDYLIELGKSVSQIGNKDPSIIYKQNSTFAFIDNGIYKPIGNIVKDGKLIQTTTSASKWSAFIVPKNGKPYIGQINPNNTGHIKLAIQSTPQIVKNGQVFINSSAEGTPSDVVNTSTKRSAIGVKSDGTIVLVTTLLPYTLKDLAQLMISFGCVEVLNLDGGSSVSSNYQNEKVTYYERPVSAAIVVRQNQNTGDSSHWASNDHEELLKYKILQSDHSKELNNSISWGDFLNIFNRMVKYKGGE